MSSIKITRYRFIAVIYPYLSMEAEVKDSVGTYYVNIDVNGKGEKEELNHSWWAYTCPLDEVDYDHYDDHVVTRDFSEVLIKMLNRWNNADRHHMVPFRETDWILFA